MKRARLPLVAVGPLLVLALAGTGPSCIDAGGRLSAQPADTADAGPPDAGRPCDVTECDIAGACVADGTRRPGVPCEACRVAVDRTRWSVLSDGAACDDGDPCTLASACVAGVCRGEPEPECADLSAACVSDVVCDVDGCARVLKPGWCFIDGGCVPGGAVRPGAPCETCAPDRATLAWSDNDGASCEDGDACTVGDTCAGGVCRGEAMDCEDGLPCTDDGCVDGACHHTVVEGRCLIDDACWEVGERKPEDPCLGCVAGLPNAWEDLSGEPCQTGNPCDAVGVCQGTHCAAEPLHIDDEPNDGAPHDIAGDNDVIQSFPYATYPGNLNPAGDIDLLRFEMQLVTLGGGYHPRVRVMGVPEDVALRVCLTVQCGTGAAARRPTSIQCVEGGDTVQIAAQAGCCRVAAPAADGGIAVEADARCGVADVLLNGVVNVEIEAADPSGLPKQCMNYTLEWGGVANQDTGG